MNVEIGNRYCIINATKKAIRRAIEQLDHLDLEIKDSRINEKAA